MPLKYFFITIKFHPSDVLIFEDFIAQLLSLIEDDTKIWCIEKDNTPDRHLHAVVSNKIKDKEYKDRHNFKQLLVPKLKSYLKKVYNQTEVDTTARTKAINISDMLDDGYRNKNNEDKIGYCAKEFTSRCGGTILPEEKEKHKLIYLNSLKITENKIKNTIEIKSINIKTALMYMYDFYETYNPPINSIIPLMIENGFSFVQISNNARTNLVNELKLKLHNQEKIKLTPREYQDIFFHEQNISYTDVYEAYDKLQEALKLLVLTGDINQSNIPIDDIRNLIQ
jgi:hypothetical protein